MTELRCMCGAVLDGVGEELLDAVEAHLDNDHHGRVPVRVTERSRPAENDWNSEEAPCDDD